ncbi:MAG: ABC transporter substrate-binding protein [Gemmatimonadota bacterium]
MIRGFRRSPWRRPVWLGLTMIAGLGVSGCARPDRNEADRPVVRVATRPFLSFAPLYTAQTRGFFEAEGLDVEFVPIQSASWGVSMLITGAIDVLPAPVSPALFRAVEQGERVRFVAGKGWIDPDGCSIVSLVSRAGALHEDRDPATSPLRLVTSNLAQIRYFIDAALSGVDLGLDDDRVDAVSIPEGAKLAALESGGVDVLTLSEPALSMATRDQRVDVIASIADVLPGTQFSVLAYGPRLIDAEPDVGRRFMAAYVRGVRAYAEGKTERNVAEIAQITGLSEEDVRGSCWVSVRDDARATSDGFADYVDWYMAHGWLETAPDLDDVIDESFVDWAVASLADSSRTDGGRTDSRRPQNTIEEQPE